MTEEPKTKEEYELLALKHKAYKEAILLNVILQAFSDTLAIVAGCLLFSGVEWGTVSGPICAFGLSLCILVAFNLAISHMTAISALHGYYMEGKPAPQPNLVWEIGIRLAIPLTMCLGLTLSALGF